MDYVEKACNGRRSFDNEHMVPLLLTMDLEVARDHELAEQRSVLRTLRRDLPSEGCPLTVFSTGYAGEVFARELRQLSEAGHEIACHGLTHQPDEDFQRMPRSRTMGP